MFESGKTYKNRYGDEYSWHKISEGVYQFTMAGDSLRWCRYGGRVGQDTLDLTDLGMFDPSGGPYVSINTEIDGQPISRIYIEDSSKNVYVEVLDANSSS